MHLLRLTGKVSESTSNLGGLLYIAVMKKSEKLSMQCNVVGRLQI